MRKQAVLSLFRLENEPKGLEKGLKKACRGARNLWSKPARDLVKTSSVSPVVPGLSGSKSKRIKSERLAHHLTTCPNGHIDRPIVYSTHLLFIY